MYRFADGIQSVSSANSSSLRICRICHVTEASAMRCSPRVKMAKTPASKYNPSTQNLVLDKFYGRFKEQFRIIYEMVELFTGNTAPSDTDDASSDDELISPCQCRGTMEYVHRGCLNQWRMASSRADSFTHCEQCFSAYQFKENAFTRALASPLVVQCMTAAIMLAWIAASFVITSNGDWILLKFTALDELAVNAESEFLHTWLLSWHSNQRFLNQLFYALVFVALTEFIFLAPSFVFAFNILFCIWRINRYEMALDTGLLILFTAIGVIRATRSTYLMLNDFTNRTVKLKLLLVVDRAADD